MGGTFLICYATKIYQFKAKDSQIKKYSLRLRNISGYFSANNMKKTRLTGYVYEFSVDYNIMANINIINIHKYLMTKYNIKWCLELIKKYSSDY